MPINRIDPTVTADIARSDNWSVRRRWLRIAVLWMGLNAQTVIGYTLYKDSSIGVQVFIVLIGAIMSLLVAYIFGAVWDDHNKREANRGFYDNDNQGNQDEDRGSENEDETTDKLDDILKTPMSKRGRKQDSEE